MRCRRRERRRRRRNCLGPGERQHGGTSVPAEGTVTRPACCGDGVMPGGSPLADLTVVDLTAGIAGAYCTKMLADGGADIVMIEPHEGNALRRRELLGHPHAFDG